MQTTTVSTPAAVTPVNATLAAALVGRAAQGGAPVTLAAGTAVRYAFVGDTAAIRVVSTGQGVKVDASALRAALAPVVSSPVTLDDLLADDAPAAPAPAPVKVRPLSAAPQAPAPAPVVARTVTVDDVLELPAAAPQAPAPAPVKVRPGHGNAAAVTRPLTERDYHGTDSFVREGKILEARTVADACAVAGLDWTVSSEEVTTKGGAKGGDLRAIVRSDTNTVLSVMSKGYHALPPAETFAPLQPLVDQGARFCGAGSFREGKTVWMQVDLGTYNVAPDGRPADEVKMFAHIRDTYDGSKAWSIQLGSIRIVCANTLMHACDHGELLARFKHNRRLASNIEAVTETLEALRCEARELVEQYRKMAAVVLTDADRAALLDQLLGDEPAEKDSREHQEWSKVQGDIGALLRGRDVIGARETDLDFTTAWAALNAVTQYTSHNVASNRAKGDALTQMRRTLEGDKVAAINDTAWEWLMEKVEEVEVVTVAAN